MNIASHSKLEESMKDVASTSLVRLIYVSRVNTTDRSVFEHIQRHSHVYNKNNKIAGFLCNDEKSFLQCLEGAKDVVFSLMQRIFKDRNHRKVDVVAVEQVSQCRFEDWRMHSLNLSASNWHRLSDHAQLGEISPFKPEHWPYWFIEYFIECVRKFDYSNISHDTNYITFDDLGYSEFEEKLTQDNILLFIFLGLLVASTAAVLLFRYDVIP